MAIFGEEIPVEGENGGQVHPPGRPRPRSGSDEMTVNSVKVKSRTTVYSLEQISTVKYFLTNLLSIKTFSGW